MRSIHQQVRAIVCAHRILARLVAVAASVLVMLAVSPLRAQGYQDQSYSQQGPQDQQQGPGVDPPSRVGRLSLMQGDVSFQPAGVQDFSAAELNYPLTGGDRLYTGDGARAEVEAGQLTARLSSRADFTVTSLTDDFAQFGLAQGSVHLRAYVFDPSAPTEIDTPIASITMLSAGDVRVDVFPQDGSTVVTVFSGQVQVNADGVEQTLQAGQALELSGAAPTRAQLVRRARPDALDQFSAQRDSQYQQAAGNQQYVNADTIGYSDLGQYGDWGDGGDYGPIWYPRDVAVDWAPYRVGHWAYIRPWGYTWVESEPWGFAPFHYGRWVQNRGRWGWIPGSPVVRPVYSPALVAFVGGPRFSLGINIGGGGGVAAWFPLGPREVYQPWYHASPVYVNRVNVTNIYNRNTAEVRGIYNNRSDVYGNRRNDVYVNRTAAMTAVPQRSFETGRPVREAALHVDPHQFDRAPILQRPEAPPNRGFNAPSPGAAPPRALPPVAARPVLADHPNANGPQGLRGGFRGGNGGGYPLGGVNQGGNAVPSASQPAAPVSRPGSTYPGYGRPNQPVANQPATAGQPTPSQPAVTQPGAPGRENGNRNGLGRNQPQPGQPVQTAPVMAQPQPQQTAPVQTPASGGDARNRSGNGRNPSQSPGAPAAQPTQTVPAANANPNEPVMRTGPRTLPPGTMIRDEDQQQRQVRDQPRQQQEQQQQQARELQQRQQDQQKQQVLQQQMQQQQQVRDQQQLQQRQQQDQQQRQERQRQLQMQQQQQQQVQQQQREQQQEQQRQQQAQQQLQIQQQQQQQQVREQQQRQQQEQLRQQQVQQQQQQQQQQQLQQQRQQQEQQRQQQQQARPQPEQPRPHVDPPAPSQPREHPAANPQ